MELQGVGEGWLKIEYIILKLFAIQFGSIGSSFSSGLSGKQLVRRDGIIFDNANPDGRVYTECDEMIAIFVKSLTTASRNTES